MFLICDFITGSERMSSKETVIETMHLQLKNIRGAYTIQIKWYKSDHNQTIIWPEFIGKIWPYSEDISNPEYPKNICNIPGRIERVNITEYQRYSGSYSDSQYGSEYVFYSDPYREGNTSEYAAFRPVKS